MGGIIGGLVTLGIAIALVWFRRRIYPSKAQRIPTKQEIDLDNAESTIAVPGTHAGRKSQKASQEARRQLA